MVNQSEGSEPRFPIRALSHKTGVNTVTLRAWERRYGLLKPARTDKGHRLYCQQDVERVQAILGWINRGVSVGQVKALLEQNADPGMAVAFEQGDGEHQWALSRETLLAAITTFHEGRIDQLLKQHFKQYPLAICVDYWLKPVLEKLTADNQYVAESAFFISQLKIRIGARLLSLNSRQQGPMVVLVPGEDSPDWRIWLMALWLVDQRCRVTVLDAPLPPVHWPHLMTGLKAHALLFYQERRPGEAWHSEVSAVKAWPFPVALSGAGMWLDAQESKQALPANMHVYARIREAADAVLEQVAQYRQGKAHG